MMSGGVAASPPRFALHTAYAAGEVSQVRSLLEAASNEVPLDVNEVNARGLTPLHVALDHPSAGWMEEIVRLLLVAGADVNTAGGRDKATPLHVACYRGNFLAVEMLLQHGADVNAVDKSRRSVLHVAVKQGSLEVIERLIESEADIEAVDKASSLGGHYCTSPCREKISRRWVCSWMLEWMSMLSIRMGGLLSTLQ